MTRNSFNIGVEFMKRLDRNATRPLAGLAAIIALLAGGPAVAQGAQQASPNAMTNLVRLLVEQKVITAEAGAALVAQAEAEAAAAQAQATAAPAPPAPGTVRIPYVPQVVKDEIREELRKEVIQQAQAEGWAAPNALPQWVSRIKVTGDLRFRSQSDFYAGTNANDLIDFDTFNEDGPTDLQGSDEVNTYPYLNSRTDRTNRLSYRARLAVEADVAPGLLVGIGLASGNNDGPTSTTQLLGGGLRKKDIWLDLAYFTVTPTPYTTLSLGRFRNPFLTDDILFDTDVNFDGVAFTLDSADVLPENLSVSFTGGAFPFEYVGNNAPTGSQRKVGDSADKWIFGGQLKTRFDSGDFGMTTGLGYYDFYNVRGRVSDPCNPNAGEPECSTDWSRPAYLNKGNTLMALRDLVIDLDEPNPPLPQFVGLVQDYNILEGNIEARFDVAEKLRLTVNGLYLRNMAFDADDACRANLPLTNIEETPVNIPNPAAPGQTIVSSNPNPCQALPGSTPIEPGGPLLAEYRSGDQAWMLRAAVGSPGLKDRGDWNVSFAYKRIEPDAVLDSLSDSDFHLGGTNAKGYIIGGNYMLFDGVRVEARWLSANEVYGRPFEINVLQMDLVAGF